MKRWPNCRTGRIKKVLLLAFLGVTFYATLPAQGRWTITQLTNNTVDDIRPDISGANVVWTGWDGSDFEIYMGTYTAVPAPGAILLAAAGVGLVAWLRRDKRL